MKVSFYRLQIPKNQAISLSKWLNYRNYPQPFIHQSTNGSLCHLVCVLPNQHLSEISHLSKSCLKLTKVMESDLDQNLFAKRARVKLESVPVEWTQYRVAFPE